MKEKLLLGETGRKLLLLIVSGISLIFGFFGSTFLPFSMAWIAVVLCGVPIVKEAVIGLVTEFDIKADVLVSMALISSLAIGEIFAAGEVAFIMQIGALLEDVTVNKAKEGLEKLISITPRTARVVRNGVEEIILAEEVKVGDLVRVNPGETVPVDGIITEGVTSIDQSVMTGESIPVDKREGDSVSSGTVNQYGSFAMRAEKVGEDSAIQRMIQLVQTADANRAKVVTAADRWATVIVILAFTTAVVTYLVTHEMLRAVTVLCVFCPCALVLATPTAIVAAIGNVSKYGILVKAGDALERLATVDRVTFDKTGTLTYGKPQVSEVHSFHSAYSDRDIFSLAAQAELRSEHPLGKAIVQSWQKEGNSIAEPETFSAVPGRGVEAVISGKCVAVGKIESATSDEQIQLQAFQNNGQTVVGVHVENVLVGCVVLTDVLRDTAAQTVQALREQQLTPVLLTGDRREAAAYMAEHAGITEIQAEYLPEEKLNAVEDWQKAGARVCMIGDGINDAPALKAAYVGIAMGGVGSDIAMEAADIVLVSDDISKLPHLFAVAKRTLKTIQRNIIFAMTINMLATVLAVLGILNPVAGALVHNGGSVLVILHSAFLLHWKQSRKK
ncbi:MAG: heavy metal translocating P-type ATPase [Oscillospiraceae bacterium]|jgi:heavy metal translocating P-type ATPase